MSSTESDLSTMASPAFSHVVILTFGPDDECDPALPKLLPDDFQAAAEDLDVRSAYFEQHYLQKRRSADQPLRPFGSPAAIAAFISDLNNHQLRFEEHCDEVETDLKKQPRGVCCIHTTIDRFSQTLSGIVKQQRDLLDVTGQKCALIVTGWIGIPCGSINESGHQPFAFESMHRTPLWIDTGVGHPCRVQTLCGSYDILPTVCELLIGTPPQDSVHSSESGTALRPASAQASCSDSNPVRTPRSLVPLLANPGNPVDREILISGLDYDAVRTRNFLLVRKHIPTLIESQTDPENCGSQLISEDDIRLYAKPEDYWNILDQSGTFQHVLENVRFEHLPE
jgi:hypothetical protein